MRNLNFIAYWPAIAFALGLWAGPVGAQPAEELDCMIQPQESVTVSFAIEGVVDEVLVDRGDIVAKDQVLATLMADVERSSLQIAQQRAAAKAQMQASRARLDIAERALARATALEMQDIVSRGEMDQALREQQLAEAGMLDAQEAVKVLALEAERAEAVLRMRTALSPLDGVVVNKILSSGEWAEPPQVMELAQIDPLRVEVFAPLRLLGRIEVGSSAEVRPEDPVGGVHAATVTVVDRVVDAASGTFGVRLALPNPDHALPAGVKCRIRFSGVGGDDGVAERSPQESRDPS